MSSYTYCTINCTVTNHCINTNGCIWHRWLYQCGMKISLRMIGLYAATSTVHCTCDPPIFRTGCISHLTYYTWQVKAGSIVPLNVKYSFVHTYKMHMERKKPFGNKYHISIIEVKSDYKYNMESSKGPHLKTSSSGAHQRWRERHSSGDLEPFPLYNTFEFSLCFYFIF